MPPTSADNNHCHILIIVARSGVALVLALSNELQKLQSRGARIIVGANWDERFYEILLDLNWTSLVDKGTKQMETLMFKTQNETIARVYVQ